MKNSSISRVTNIILILMFVGLIWLPLIGGIFGFDTTHNLGEKRILAQCPAFGKDRIESIPEEFEAFYKDRFGFRNRLIRGHNWIKYRFLKGGSLGKVLFGKDDWLFFTKAGIIPDYLGQKQFSPEQLARWKDVLQQRQEWLAARGVRYLFVVAPNKTVIYPEKLPDHIRMRKGLTLMDQLVSYLEKNSTVELLDLRDCLRAEKDEGLVYHPKDTHWTDRGAYIVYHQICERLSRCFLEIRPRDTSDFNITVKMQEGDLATMLGLTKELANKCEAFVPKVSHNTSRLKLELPDQYPWPESVKANDQLAMENKTAKHRLLFFHDSFSVEGGLREYLGEHFSRSAFVPVEIDGFCLKLMVEQEHPDIVIEEIAERKLKDVPSPETSL